MSKLWSLSCALVTFTTLGCANQTTFHTAPLGARVYVNGALCGDSPCVYHTRYGFPDRIHVELQKEGYEPADFYLDTEPPQISYLLLGFGSYLFHTFSQEYRFQLKPLPSVAVPAAPDESGPPAHAPPATPPSPSPPQNQSPTLPPRSPEEAAPARTSPEPFWI
jgi:hypothetical protein